MKFTEGGLKLKGNITEGASSSHLLGHLGEGSDVLLCHSQGRSLTVRYKIVSIQMNKEPF